MASGGGHGGPGPGGGPGGHGRGGSGAGGWRLHPEAALRGFATGTTAIQQRAASAAERQAAQLAELAAKRTALMCHPNLVEAARNDPPSAAVVAQMPFGFPVFTGFSPERLVAEERARLAAVVEEGKAREREMTLEMERAVLAAAAGASPTDLPAAAASGNAGGDGAAAAAAAGGVASLVRGGSASPGALLPSATTLAAALAEARREQDDLRQAAERRAADGGDADRVAATAVAWAPVGRRAPAADDDSDGDDDALRPVPPAAMAERRAASPTCRAASCTGVSGAPAACPPLGHNAGPSTPDRTRAAPAGTSTCIAVGTWTPSPSDAAPPADMSACDDDVSPNTASVPSSSAPAALTPGVACTSVATPPAMRTGGAARPWTCTDASGPGRSRRAWRGCATASRVAFACRFDVARHAARDRCECKRKSPRLSCRRRCSMVWKSIRASLLYAVKRTCESAKRLM